MHKNTHPCSCGGDTHPPLSQPPPPPPKNDVVSIPFPSLQPYLNNHDPHHRNRLISPPFMVTTTVTTVASSWLRNRRIRYLFLLLCSPLLLILLFVSLPFLCAVEFCLRRRLRKFARESEEGGHRIRRCEEGCCGDRSDEEEKGLLHRYLEDQLVLVGSMYDCGEEDEDDYKRVEDIENQGNTSTIPLLR